jgi:hypothetical protein
MPFSLVTLLFLFTDYIYTIYAQIYEFNAEDFFNRAEKEREVTKPTKTNSNDTNKETCINNQIEALFII